MISRMIKRSLINRNSGFGKKQRYSDPVHRVFLYKSGAEFMRGGREENERANIGAADKLECFVCGWIYLSPLKAGGHRVVQTKFQVVASTDTALTPDTFHARVTRITFSSHLPLLLARRELIPASDRDPIISIQFRHDCTSVHKVHGTERKNHSRDISFEKFTIEEESCVFFTFFFFSFMISIETTCLAACINLWRFIF